jgi:hypothetical protein
VPETLADELRALLERGPAPRQKILFWDLESAPLLAFIWSARTEYVGTHMIEHEAFLLSWAAKWADQPKVLSGVLTPEEALAQDDSRIVADLGDLLREADVVVAHNGDRFDVPRVNSRLLLQGLEPLGPLRTIDTLKLARRSFRLASNKLDWLAEQLGHGNKLSTTFALWERCYRGDPKALAEMVRYNRKDVVLLEEVYRELEPYVSGLPRLVDADGRSMLCPTCGSDKLEQAGFHRTNSSTFPRYRCGDCKRYSRSRTADRSKKLDLMPL